MISYFCFFVGYVMYWCLCLVVNVFVYLVFFIQLLVVDLVLGNGLFFGVDCSNVFSFYQKDYGLCDGMLLLLWIQLLLCECGLVDDGEVIL